MTAVQKEITDYVLKYFCACATPQEVINLEKIIAEPLRKEIEELKKQLRGK